jgi:hypothetical protein
MIEPRTYYDTINEATIHFQSDASQARINSLDFNGEWFVVREILRDWGYTVIENISLN